ncbi:MAG: hypothetical protein HC849_23685, partial [Oscillatoriales cyanobacterium RU_3_3]|nr:hypothetical protein [Oscillatoriales cyanobacterium RU_3_3]
MTVDSWELGIGNWELVIYRTGFRVKHKPFGQASPTGIKPEIYCRYYRQNASPLLIYTTILRIKSNCQLLTVNSKLKTQNSKLKNSKLKTPS